MAGGRDPHSDRLAKWGSAGLLAGAILLSVLGGEVIARVVDDRGIFGEPTYFGTPQLVPIDEYIAMIEAGRKSVGELWKRSPPPLVNRRAPQEEDLERLRQFGSQPIWLNNTSQLQSSDLFKVWNSKLADDACNHPVLERLSRWPLDLFDSAGGDDRPRYRYRPNTTLPTGLVTNQIGWRGRPVEDLTPQTIRIVFVGASTIAEAPDLPWSAPELVDVGSTHGRSNEARRPVPGSQCRPRGCHHIGRGGNSTRRSRSTSSRSVIFYEGALTSIGVRWSRMRRRSKRCRGRNTRKPQGGRPR